MSEERFLLAYEMWLRCGKMGGQPDPLNYGVSRDLSDKIAKLDEQHTDPPPVVP